MVNIVYDSRQIISCRSRNDNVLSTSVDVSLCLVLAGVETSTLKYNIYAKLAPRKVSCLSFCIDCDLLSVNSDAVLIERNLIC